MHAAGQDLTNVGVIQRFLTTIISSSNYHDWLLLAATARFVESAYNLDVANVRTVRLDSETSSGNRP
jgi:hypothetical protein